MPQLERYTYKTWRRSKGYELDSEYEPSVFHALFFFTEKVVNSSVPNTKYNQQSSSDYEPIPSQTNAQSHIRGRTVLKPLLIHS